MFSLDDGNLVLSATDLTNYLACGHLTQQRLAIARKERPKPRPVENPLDDPRVLVRITALQRSRGRFRQPDVGRIRIGDEIDGAELRLPRRYLNLNPVAPLERLFFSDADIYKCFVISFS